MDTESIAVIPAYNESATVGAVVRDTTDHVDEVLVVDDGSRDETAAIARENGATVIEHVINTGVGGAQRTGYRYAIKKDYSYIVQIDADGQHDPASIPRLLEAVEDHDMVIGSRYLNESINSYSLVRRQGIKFFTWLVNILGGIEITDVTSGFRVYRVTALESIIHHSDRHWAVEQTLGAAQQGLRIKEISVEMPERTEGTSQFDLGTFLFYPIRMADVVLRILLFR